MTLARVVVSSPGANSCRSPQRRPVWRRRGRARRSLELLLALGALDARGELTQEVGQPLARLPVDPMFGKVLLAAAGMGCTLEAVQVRDAAHGLLSFPHCCSGSSAPERQRLRLLSRLLFCAAGFTCLCPQVVAMVSSEGVWVSPRAHREAAAAAHAKFAAREGDHLALLAVARAFAEQPRKAQVAWCHDSFLNFRWGRGPHAPPGTAPPSARVRHIPPRALPGAGR